MAYKDALSAGKMAARIYNREDNIYKQSMIKEILDMYAKEVHKAMMNQKPCSADSRWIP